MFEMDTTHITQVAGIAITTGALVVSLTVPALAAEVPAAQLPQVEPMSQEAVVETPAEHLVLVETIVEDGASDAMSPHAKATVRAFESSSLQRAAKAAIAAAQIDFEQRKATLLQAQDPLRELKREIGSAAKEMILHA